MIAARITPADLRQALQELALAASGFVRGRGRAEARANLAAAIRRANAALAAGDAFSACREAEALVDAYLAAGGDRPALAAAVNRAGRAGRPQAARSTSAGTRAA